MKYLILCDMDGTLLDNKNELSSYTEKVIKEIATKHTFCLVTSNSLNNTLPIYSKLELNTYLACENGGLITNPNDHISENHFFFIKSNYILQLFNDLKDIIKSMFYKIDNEAFCYKFEERYKYVMSIPNDSTIYNEDFNNIKLKDAPNVFFIIDPSKQEEFEEYFSNDKVNLDLIGKDKKRVIYIISHPKSTKYEASVLFKNFYSYDKVIAIGDSINDIEMLKNSDIPILMRNSYIKNTNFKVSNYSNNEDGVAKELTLIIE